MGHYAWLVIGPISANHESETTEVNRKFFIIAEYCAAQFYTGWWLYERDHNDGTQNDRGFGGWGWMRDGSSYSKQQDVNDLCRRMGHEPPAVTRHSQDFAKWFASTFPNGLRVHIVDDGYELLEIIKRWPRQRRGVIRTIKGAAAARRTPK